MITSNKLSVHIRKFSASMNVGMEEGQWNQFMKQKETQVANMDGGNKLLRQEGSSTK